MSNRAAPRWPSPRVVYSRHYNIGLAGVERLHPFDSRKYGRAWRLLRGRFGARLGALRVTPPRAAGHEDLLHVHTPGYLARLRDPKFVARVIELPPLRYVPSAPRLRRPAADALGDDGDHRRRPRGDAAGVLRRDQFVLDELLARRLPTVVVPSGGYSPESYRMLADRADTRSTVGGNATLRQ